MFDTMFNFTEHLVDVGRREGMFHCSADSCQFFSRIGNWLTLSRFAQSPANPLARGQVFAAGETLDFHKFGIRKEDLKTLTHDMSI